ncbi:neuraminidase-like domain-containing protein [Burkholderia ubonensis]|uniref:Tc toxin subunit A-related protein n=1 Tax=Burkholderia ubonensis TaxID=101571 RepID=UPI000B505532|nr:neuraminidase-like domain-containing protein [Burkholderia ubonensis]
MVYLNDIADGRFSAIVNSNPDFNLGAHDFFLRPAEQTPGLDTLAPHEIETLKTYQRLLRITDDGKLADRLVAAGLTSAHKIARNSERQFIAEHARQLGLTEDGAGILHRSAIQAKIRAQNAAFALRYSVGSAAFRAGAMNTVGADMLDYVGAIPSYQDFFGSLDYCNCDPDQSIYSPAAYLVDLLRVVYQYIDTATYNPSIPDGCHLAQRRPDIGNIPLTPEMTRQLVPYLQIVNEALEANIAGATQWPDVFRAFTAQIYPFALPTILPLTQTRLYSAALGTTLLQLYDVFAAREQTPPAANLPGPEAIGREAIGLSPTTQKIVTTVLSSAADIGPYYGIADGRLLSFTATGTASAAQNSTAVTGSGTRFTTEIRIGDNIQLGAQRSRVVAIGGDTQLTVADAWTAAVSGAAILDFPPTDLGTSLVFSERTGVPYEALSQLLSQNLSDAELAAGIATQLFINQGQTAQTCLKLTVDQSDPTRPVSRIANMNLAALDRLNRFIRVANASGIASADLDWMIETVGQRNIDAAAISRIGRTRQLAESLSCTLLEASALFQPLKTIGVGDPRRPLDPFDQLFNAPSVLGTPAGSMPAFTAKGSVTIAAGSTTVTGTGTRFTTQVSAGMRVRVNGEIRVVATVPTDTTLTVGSAFSDAQSNAVMVVIPTPDTPSDALPIYHPLYAGNPLYQDVVANWKPTADAGDAPDVAGVRSRLRSGLNVVDNDLTAIGQAALNWLVASGTLPAGSTAIPLTVPNMSLLYAYAKLARQAGLTVTEYLTLLQLLGIPATSDLDTTIGVAAWAAWLKNSHLGIDALDYGMTGRVSKNFSPAFLLADLPNFLAALWQTAQNWLVLGNGFIDQDITAEQSQAYFVQLSAPEAGFLTIHGAVLDKAVDFAAIAFIDPLGGDAFITPLISAAQSQSAHDDLITHEVLNQLGVLSARFSSSTNLDFLFSGLPDRVAMIAEVRAILVATQDRLNHVVDVLLNFGGAPTVEYTNRGIQRFHLSEQLGVALGSDTGIMLALGPSVAVEVGLDNYVAAFLTPPDGNPPPVKLQDFMTLMTRLVTLFKQLAFTASDVSFVVQYPAPFGIAGLTTLSLANIRALWTYRQLRQNFNDEDGRLPAYLAAPDQGACTSDPKFKDLSLMTGWPVDQICELRAALFGTGSGYNTVMGLAGMAACFKTASSLGLDIHGTLTLARLNVLPAQVDTAAWTAYNHAATATIGSLKARYGGPQWETFYRPIENAVNEARRDALLPYAVFSLGKKYPVITDAESLYTYLLIDVEMCGCADISYIAQAIQSVQLYMQRARMMLEPGITDVAIPEVWWTWLSAYRMWEANRKVFLYPENYLEPGLRPDKTQQFQAAEDTLTSNDITPETVNDTYVDYFESFSALSALKRVGSYCGTMPDPDALGAMTPTLYVISRTATEPYTYYAQRKINDISWTAFEKIDLTMPTPRAAPLYAYDRLFLFWVEQNATSASQIQGGSATNSLDTGATLKYSFINQSGKWVLPQTLDHFTINFAPMQGGYSTPEVNPASFDVSQAQWQMAVPFLIKGKNGAQDTILVNYGQFYDLPGGSPSDPTKPNPSVITNPDAFALATNIYESSLYAVKATNQGLRGATYVNQGRLLLQGLDVSPTYVIDGAYNMVPNAPKPYVPVIPRTVMPPGDSPVMGIAGFSNVFLMNAVGEGAAYTWTPINYLTLLYNVNDRAGFTAPTINQPFWFIWDNGDETFMIRSTEPGIKQLEEYVNVSAGSETNQTNLISGKYTETPGDFNSIIWSAERLSTGATSRLNKALFVGGVPQLLLPQTQATPVIPLYPFTRFFDDNGQQPPNIDPPFYLAGDTIDYKGPYGLYFWEIFLYCPWLIANQLRANQRYPEARTWLEYIFNPTVPINSDPTVTDQSKRFWRLIVFRNFTVESLQSILTDPAQIRAYNNYPFQPHVIARLRGSAYQKAIVMRYIDVLLEWGDFEFTKDSWESITQATLLYVLARDILGPRPIDVGACTQQPPSTFNQIQAKYGTDIPQFLIDMENVAPPPSHGSVQLDQTDRFVPFNELDSYFCVPENSTLMKYWDLVEDRLYKIRHCMNIQGVVRQLALFEPPIDPMMLVSAAAAGVGARVADQLQAGAPPYRFGTIARMAGDFSAQLSQLGNLLLSALEKKDAEALARLNATQTIQILNLTTKSLELQISENQEQITGLTVSQQAATSRRDFYQLLIDTGLLPVERLQIAMQILSNVFGTTGGVLEGFASGAFLVPDVGSPFAMTYGGREIGSSLHAAATVFDILAQTTKGVSEVSQIVSGFERRDQDWQQQLTQANFDVEVLDSQIRAANLQLQIAQQQLSVHRRNQDNAAEVDDFLRRKFTNAELYQWMISRLSNIYSQAYRMALELAMAAQQCYQFETNTNDKFITFDYWDGLRKGLLAGEQLSASLAQMTSSYYCGNNRRLEIEKTISLLALDPEAFIRFQRTGTCDIRFSEYLFDLDYPGQYARQIKSVSVTIPAILGPNQNIKAILTQTGSQILLKPDINGVDYLLGLGSATPDTSVLRANWRASQKVALSSGLGDTGTFQDEPNDDRYLPFEGTGAISSWRLEMPLETNRINYSTLTDVVIRLRYTAQDAGAVFASQVRAKINSIPYQGQRAFNLAANFPTAWFGFTHPPAGATQQSFDIVIVQDWFPANLSLNQITEIDALLQLAQGVSMGGPLMATLRIGTGNGATSLPLTFSAANGAASLTSQSINNWVNQPWSLIVAKRGVPPGLVDPTTGLLDPAKVLSIGLLLTYSARRP